MMPAEREGTRRFVLAVRRLFKARGVAESPLLALRVRELAVLRVVTQRLEAQLAEPVKGEAAMPPNGKQAAIEAETIGKAWERLRKALKELEDHIDKHGHTTGASLADEMRPVLTKAGGLAEEWLAQWPPRRPGASREPEKSHARATPVPPREPAVRLSR